MHEIEYLNDVFEVIFSFYLAEEVSWVISLRELVTSLAVLWGTRVRFNTFSVVVIIS